MSSEMTAKRERVVPWSAASFDRPSAERQVLITRDLRSQPVIHSIAALA